MYGFDSGRAADRSFKLDRTGVLKLGAWGRGCCVRTGREQRVPRLRNWFS